MKGRVLLITLAVLALAPASAVAQESALGLAQDAAASYWNPPCQGGVQIAYAPTPVIDATAPSPAGYVTGAYATWQGTIGGPLTDCVVTVNSTQFPPAQQAVRFQFFCGLMAHEYSHFLGYEDDPSYAPTSITYEFVGPQSEHIAPCVARYGQASALVLAQFEGTVGGHFSRRAARTYRAKRAERRSWVS